MNAPKDITGPDDLAATVRSATDPLDEYPNYGTAAAPPGDESSRPAEITEQLDERGISELKWSDGYEQYISDYPLRSMVAAAAVGAIAAALLFGMFQRKELRRW